jgi:hypothetical protein
MGDPEMSGIRRPHDGHQHAELVVLPALGLAPAEQNRVLFSGEGQHWALEGLSSCWTPGLEVDWDLIRSRTDWA